MPSLPENTPARPSYIEAVGVIADALPDIQRNLRRVVKPWWCNHQSFAGYGELSRRGLAVDIVKNSRASSLTIGALVRHNYFHMLVTLELDSGQHYLDLAYKQFLQAVRVRNQSMPEPFLLFPATAEAGDFVVNWLEALAQADFATNPKLSPPDRELYASLVSSSADDTSPFRRWLKDIYDTIAFAPLNLEEWQRLQREMSVDRYPDVLELPARLREQAEFSAAVD